MDGTTAMGVGAGFTTLAPGEFAGMAPTASFWDIAPESSGTAGGQLLYKQLSWSGSCGANRATTTVSPG